jgi:dTDP-4-dehydrorhamnose reductase
MKVLILGGNGMAGHVITAYFKKLEKYDVYYTSRGQEDKGAIYLDVTNLTKLEEIIDTIKPDITINCIGILNAAADKDIKLAFQVNSLLPHQLVKLMERHQGKLIHISTDCVFSGERGDYIESDIPDGTSFYSQSKQLGEVISSNHLTVRTSIIGPELKSDGIGLFLWFMKQTGTIKGYKNVWWNGVTTLELAKSLDQMITCNVNGLFQLGAVKKISKYDLLVLIKDIFQKQDVLIEPDYHFIQDRTIKNTRSDFIYKIPDYPTMIQEMRDWMMNNEPV